MPFIPREEALARLRNNMTAGRPIIGAGAGTGISAKFAERGGVDLIIIYNSGRYRMAGRGSMAGLLPTVMRTQSSWRWPPKSCRLCKTRWYWPASAAPTRFV